MVHSHSPEAIERRHARAVARGFLRLHPAGAAPTTPPRRTRTRSYTPERPAKLPRLPLARTDDLPDKGPNNVTTAECGVQVDLLELTGVHGQGLQEGPGVPRAAGHRQLDRGLPSSSLSLPAPGPIDLFDTPPGQPNVTLPDQFNDTLPDQLNLDPGTPAAALEGFGSVPEEEFQHFLADMFGSLVAPSQVLPFRSKAYEVFKQFCLRRGWPTHMVDEFIEGPLDYFDITLDDWRDPDNDQALTGEMEEIVMTVTDAARDFLQQEFECFVADAESGQSDL